MEPARIDNREQLERKIGFSEVLESISAHCASAVTVPLLRESMRYSTDTERVSERLGETEEMMNLTKESGDSLPLGEVSDVRLIFSRTRAEGSFMEIDEVGELRKNLLVLGSVVMYLRSADTERFPRLTEMVRDAETFQDVIQRIDSIIDKYGEVRDGASEELRAIRRSMKEAQGSVVRTLNAILKEAKAHGYIDSDVSPTMREGRLMLPVPAANKKMVHGIVHDESATGKTSFIEPAAVVEINNRLRELEGEERREIIRILTELTESLRPYYGMIEDAMRLVARIDAIHAKAKYALRTGSVVPNLTKNLVEIFQARHPMLEQSLKAQGKEIVPLDIKLSKKQRILIISGPNAGGKSVCLKTLGLLQYMLGCGQPIPVAERSSTMLFSQIMVDIGDEQSIENDLSTYSSHLMNMKRFLRQSDGRSLLLIDEFGSGTEPMIGGAIAEAILSKLNEKGVYAVITTHYSNLKNFASKTPGVANGAMLYDRHNMQPLFALSIGMAGSSFAIDIAKKIGLPNEVIEAAVALAGEEQVDFDKYLQDVARDKRYWEKKREQIREQERHLKQVTEQYDAKMAEVRKEEKKIIAEARNEAAEIITNANAEIEKTIRTIKENSAERIATREARRALKEHTEGLIAANVEEKKKARVFKVGETVQIEGQQMVGKVVDVQGKQAVVLFGQMKTTVAMSKLVGAAAPKREIKSSNIVDVMHDRQNQFNPEIDLRGMRVDEALQEVVAFIDDAAMLHAGQVRILHGTGTGALREAVRQYLSCCSVVKEYRDEHVQFGGAGVTVVVL